MFEFFVIGSFSWFISTMVGGGGAMIFVPLAGMIVPIALVVPAVSIAGVISGSQRIYLYRDHIDWNVAKLVVPGIIVGAISGASLIVYVNQNSLAIFLACFYLLAGIWPFLKKRTRSFTVKSGYFPLGGFVSSFMSGAVGTGGPFMNPLYLGYGLTKESLVGTKACTTLLMQLIKVATYFSLGLYTRDVVFYGLLASLGAGIGNYLGSRQLTSISSDTFKYLVSSMLVVCSFVVFYRTI